MRQCTKSISLERRKSPITSLELLPVGIFFSMTSYCILAHLWTWYIFEKTTRQACKHNNPISWWATPSPSFALLQEASRSLSRGGSFAVQTFLSMPPTDRGHL